MLSRWNFARLKAAENALNEGRIDEAYERLTRPETKNNPKAQGLLDLLSASFLARARVHAQAGRYVEALADLDRLSAIDRFSPEARTLRERVEKEHQHRVERHAAGGDAYRKAEHDIRAGRLDAGQMAIENLESPERREQLREELDIRVKRNAQLLHQARESFEQDDLLTACRFWEEACTKHGRTRESDSFGAELAQACCKRLDDAFLNGRLEQLQTLLSTTPALQNLSPALAEYQRLIDLTHVAGRRLADADYAGLRDKLLRLQAARGDVAWIKAAQKPLDEILQARARLLSSPLGLLSASFHNLPAFGKAAEPGIEHNRPVLDANPRRLRGAPFGGESLLMLVDGTGSALMTARDLLRIGRAGAKRDLEVPIPADIQSHHADIIRDGDDYFLVARGPVRVNRKAINRTLLRHGDRIVLGKNAKMVFHKPSAKSETAVLKLSGGCRLPQDVSLVVMFRGACLIGPQAACHVQTREGDSRLVLFDKAGELFVRSAARDGRPTGSAAPLPADATRDFGDLRLTVKEYNAYGTDSAA